eukprot:TRINITY_DN30555_c0_g1_i1.p1 TRINITY_DN30555_c0_g1~~TRINITY_DN30555_c0_g1_i1.p1  ORF type:complete len:236 (+),score=43.23 TRINITY_DN30555_c0_g1_i1:75-710(+)
MGQGLSPSALEACSPVDRLPHGNDYEAVGDDLERSEAAHSKSIFDFAGCQVDGKELREGHMEVEDIGFLDGRAENRKKKSEKKPLLKHAHAKLECKEAVALANAVTYGNSDLVRRVLQGGADVNKADAAAGFTALHHAALHSASDTLPGVIRVLLEFQADPELRDCRGETALDLCRRSRPEELLALQRLLRTQPIPTSEPPEADKEELHIA